MARWLLRSEQPVIVVDWSDLKPDKSWGLLRAAVPVGGRTLPVPDMVFPGGQIGTPKAEQAFLLQLNKIVPEGATPILVTDAGYRAPWFRAVDAMGWHWLGRLRRRTLVKPVGAHGQDDWVPSRALYALLDGYGTRDMGLMDTVRDRPWACRVVIHRYRSKGRKHRNLNGEPARTTSSRKVAARYREPWLLVASPNLQLSARQLVRLYARRIQIEQSFRDLKSHHYGSAFEDSLTRRGTRLDILLLIHALASFASWLAGMACEAAGIDCWLSPIKTRRRLYSTMRVGREALVRSWPIGRIVDADVKLTRRADWILTRGYDALGVWVGV